MPLPVEELKILMHEKAGTLLARGREFLAYRRTQERMAVWLDVFHDLTLDNQYMDSGSVFQKWAKVMTGKLDFQVAGAFRVEPDNELAHLLVAEPREYLPILVRIRPEERLFFRRRRCGTVNGPFPAEVTPFAGESGLKKFHWMSFINARGTEFLLLAGFTPDAAKFSHLSPNDEGHFSMVGNLLAAVHNNAVLFSEVELDRKELRKMNVELDRSIRDLRRTQEELIRSTRLASVGEMAGQTAHEVLNPITSIHGRLSRMLASQDAVYRSNLDVFDAVLTAWDRLFREGGIDAVMTSLKQKVDADASDGNRVNKTFFEDDLSTLRALHAFFFEEGKTQAKGVRFLLREVDRVVRIIDGMRSLTRRQGTRAPFVLRGLLEESLETMEDVLNQAGISSDVSCPRDLYVFLDRYEFMQVMTNLIRNGMLAIEEKRGTKGGVITLSATKNEDRIALRIADNGTGIQEEYLPLLFESRFSSRSSGRGTGLGLSICRRLVRGFGGEIIVETTVFGEGTTFLIEMPVYSGDETNNQRESVYNG